MTLTQICFEVYIAIIAISSTIFFLLALVKLISMEPVPTEFNFNDREDIADMTPVSKPIVPAIKPETPVFRLKILRCVETPEVLKLFCVNLGGKLYELTCLATDGSALEIEVEDQPVKEHDCLVFLLPKNKIDKSGRSPLLFRYYNEKGPSQIFWEFNHTAAGTVISGNEERPGANIPFNDN